MDRFLQCVHLPSPTNPEIHFTYYIGTKLVSEEEYHLAYVRAHRAGNLEPQKMQSTGFGYRMVTEQRHRMPQEKCNAD